MQSGVPVRENIPPSSPPTAYAPAINCTFWPDRHIEKPNITPAMAPLISLPQRAANIISTPAAIREDESVNTV